MKGRTMGLVTRLTTIIAVAAVTMLGLAACGSDSSDPEPAPAGAITLQQNIPRPIEGAQLVAYNIAEDSAWLSIATAGAEAVKQQVLIGDTIQVGATEYAVHSISVGADSAAPGTGSGQVVITPVR